MPPLPTSPKLWTTPTSDLCLCALASDSLLFSDSNRLILRSLYHLFPSLSLNSQLTKDPSPFHRLEFYPSKLLLLKPHHSHFHLYSPQSLHTYSFTLTLPDPLHACPEIFKDPSPSLSCTRGSSSYFCLQLLYRWQLLSVRQPLCCGTQSGLRGCHHRDSFPTPTHYQ